MSIASLIAASCPVCAYSVAAPFFSGGMQTLATLGWPPSGEAARSMPRYPLDYVQCPRCTHVWNRSFTYEAIPYEKQPMRMFNKGGIWKGHLAKTRDLLLDHLPTNPTVVDIGCGEGHFVRGLAEACRNHGRFVGFDPSASPESGCGVEFHPRLFEPLADMPVFVPDAVTFLHVLEHLTDPAVLLEQLAWGAASLGKTCCWLFAETPCVDRALETGRLADFFYEHPSQFTTRSFRTLMERAGQIVELDHGYDGEVVYALVKLSVPDELRQQAGVADAFSRQSVISREMIRGQLAALQQSGKRIAIWGGTGKAAAFMHQFGVDACRFPLVVDSDPDKVGTFVPGHGQEIRFRDALKEPGTAADVVIIPGQWRARDIVAEMDREGIQAETVLIEHEGQLVDFRRGSHPYR